MPTQPQPQHQPSLLQVAIGALISVARALPGADIAALSFLDSCGIAAFPDDGPGESPLDVLDYLRQQGIEPASIVPV